MPRGGLSRERVIEATAALIERDGASNFSMRALADSLNIRTASLYNHVDSMETLIADVCAYALRAQREMELAAIDGHEGAQAIRALAEAYRQFAKERRELYRLIMSTVASCADGLGEAAQCIVEPFLKVLAHADLTPEEKIHWQRVLRGIVHGFVAQEEAGFFSHLAPDVGESFRIAIECYIDGLAQAEARKKA